MVSSYKIKEADEWGNKLFTIDLFNYLFHGTLKFGYNAGYYPFLVFYTKKISF